MSDDRTELLRTQAMQTLLTALGAANVNVYGDDRSRIGGVFLHDDRSASSVTYWNDADGKRWQYDVRVHVDVYRREVPRV